MTPIDLRLKRKKYKISQYSLAKKSGVARFKISTFENGYCPLNKEELDRINKVLRKASHANA